MNKEKEMLMFECFSVLLSQDSITINPEYQERLIKECDKLSKMGEDKFGKEKKKQKKEVENNV